MARQRLEPGSHGLVRKVETKTGWKFVANVRGLDGRYFECSGSGSSQEKANTKLQMNIARRLGGASGTPGFHLTSESTVREVAEGWAAHVENLNIGAAGTRHEERRLMRARIITKLGDFTIREIGSSNVLDWYIAEHAATPRQAANALSVLRRIGEFAIARQLRGDNICDGVHRFPQKEADELAVPTADELDELRRVVRAWMDRPGRMGPRPSPLLLDFIEVAIGTGGRTGEVMGLRWIDIDTTSDEPTVHIRGEVQEGKGRVKERVDRTKTKSGVRQVTIPPVTVQILRERRKRHPETFYVFETKNGTPVGMQEVHRQLRNVRKWAELPASWIPYAFRKAAITAVAETEGPEAAARFAGHNHANITEKFYWKKNPRVGNLVDALDKLAPAKREVVEAMILGLATSD